MINKILNPHLMIQRTILLDDWLKQCERENGGVEKLIVAEKCKIDSTSITVTGRGANREITAVSMQTGYQAYEWTPDLEDSFATDNATGNRENNSYFRTHAAMVKFKDDQNLTAQLDEEAGRSTGLVFFVKYATPAGESTKWKAFGFFNGLRLTTSEAGTGQLYEDLRGHTLNFEVKELTRALLVDEAIVEALLTPPS